ncbi:class I SAM-dependent methyltransferase [Proteinivorax tanatarense]|uniref:Class I SAM-dependent methyltransferase n=1 Tax=Proteinivorax tanatarense TaxID=1260629 RepID=A0AAU7VK38_9FIRM
MLNSKGFDKWSGEYDNSIAENSGGYPFEGYYNVLGFVQNLIKSKQHAKILDLGVGTGLLTYQLYKKGAKIYGADFSKNMLEKAKLKMPKASFYYFDFSKGLPNDLKNLKFDYIVSSYALHHIENDKKVKLLKYLRKQLKPDGKIVIADIGFENKEILDKCRSEVGQEWDDEEFYLAGDEIIDRLAKLGMDVSYTQISFCAGVLEIG